MKPHLGTEKRVVFCLHDGQFRPYFNLSKESESMMHDREQFLNNEESAAFLKVSPATLNT